MQWREREKKAAGAGKERWGREMEGKQMDESSIQEAVR